MISTLLCLPQQVFFAAAEEDDETVIIKADFIARTSGRRTQIDVPYSDDWFRQDATVYNHDLARASLGLAVSAFRPGRNDDISFKPEFVQNFLSQAGFSRFRDDDYDRPSGRYTIASGIASKTIEDEDGPFTLIAIGVSGQGYGDEWLSNFSIGDGDIHQGFEDASDDIYDRLWGYIAENHIERPFKVWVTGFSRAGAISNIFAASLEQDDLLRAEDVFAYTFATPRTVKDTESGRHDNIFNIVGAVDPVPQVPFQDWGFDRYGTTFYTPSQETSSRWYSAEQRANEVYRSIVGFDTWSNPVINTQIKVLTEYLLEICPDNSTYSKYLQNEVCEMWKHSHSPIDLMKTLIEVSENSNLITPENEAEANSLLDYALYSSLEYLFYSDRMVYLEDRASVTMNIMHEHTPEVYISWMFSDTPPEELFTDNRSFARISFEGDTDVNIYDLYSSSLLETIPADGEITYCSDDVRLFALRAHGKTIIYVPYDTDYSIELLPRSETTVETVGIDYTSEQTRITEYWETTFDIGVGDVVKIGVSPSMKADVVKDKESIHQIRSETTETLSSIQRFETLNVFDLEWRDFVLVVMTLFIITSAFTVFVFTYTAGKLRWRRRVKSGSWEADAKYYGLPVFCLCLIFAVFLLMEINGSLFPNALKDRLQSKLFIGLLLLIIAWHGYRHYPSELNLWNIPALILFTAADVIQIYSFEIGLIVRIIAVLVMLGSFVRQSRPVLSQYVIFFVLIGLNLLFLLWIRKRFTLVIDLSFWLLAVNMFLSTALFIASMPQPKRYRTGATLLLISGLSLYTRTGSPFTFFTHLLFAGIYYAAVSFFAAASIKIMPKSQPAKAEEQSPETPAAA